MLGLGESVMYPASFEILAREALEGQRGRANGFLALGLFAGPTFGTLAGGLLMAWLGWRIAFVVFGCASFLWLWPWLRTPRASTPQRAHGMQDCPSTLMILRGRELWGSCLGLGPFAVPMQIEEAGRDNREALRRVPGQDT